MAKKKYSINWDDDVPVSFEVDGVEYESLDDIPDETDRIKLEAMIDSASDAEIDAEFAKVEDAFVALQANQIDAIVYDAPVLLYYAAHEGKGNAQTVGTIFRKENYGVAFPDKSPLRKRVNEVLLKLKENGTYDQLYGKWFGGAGS